MKKLNQMVDNIRMIISHVDSALTRVILLVNRTEDTAARNEKLRLTLWNKDIKNAVLDFQDNYRQMHKRLEELDAHTKVTRSGPFFDIAKKEVDKLEGNITARILQQLDRVQGKDKLDVDKYVWSDDNRERAELLFSELLEDQEAMIVSAKAMYENED